MNLKYLTFLPCLFIFVIVASEKNKSNVNIVTRAPIILKPGEGSAITHFKRALIQTSSHIKLSKNNTLGAFTLIESEWSSGWSPDLHLHENHDVSIIVLEGEFDFIVNNNSSTISNGMMVYLPRKTPHTFKVENFAKVLINYSFSNNKESILLPSPMTNEDLEIPTMVNKTATTIDTIFIDSDKNENQDSNNFEYKILKAEQGERVDLAMTREVAYFKLLAKETSGAYTLVEDYFLPKGKVRPHRHHQHDEAFYIVEGNLIARIGDMPPFIASPGTLIYVPRGTAHGFDASERVKIHMYYAPGGLLEKGAFKLREMTNEQLKDPNTMVEHAKQHDIEIIHE